MWASGDRGRVPPVVWLVTGLFALVLVGWSLLTPMGRSPDEGPHADLIFDLASGAPYPDYDERRLSEPGRDVVYAYSLNSLLTPDSAPPRAERRTLREWGWDEPTQLMNQMPQHPPLYYWVSASALRVERSVIPGGGDAPLDREWHLLRLLNVAMVAPLPLFAWAAARRLGADPLAAIAASIVPLGVPQLTHIGASLNNDNLLIGLGGVLAVLLAGVVRGDRRRSLAAGVGVVAGLALLTKAFAFVFLPWIALAYGYQAWRRRDARQGEPAWHSSTVGLAIAGATATVIGGWWHLQNLIEHGDLRPTVMDAKFATSPPGFEVDPLWWLGQFITNFADRFWGGLTFDLAPVVVLVATVVLGGLTIAAFSRRPAATDGASSPPRPSHLVVFAAPLAFLVTLVALNAYQRYASSGELAFIQGRYLFSAMVPLAVLAGLGAVRLLGRWAPVLLLAAAAVMQVLAVGVGLRTWWAEPGASVGRTLSAVRAWSPWPVGISYAVLVAIGLGVVSTTILLWPCRHPRRDKAEDDEATALSPQQT